MLLRTNEEALEVCRVGQGDKCCAYIVTGGRGMECAKEDAVLAVGMNGRTLAQQIEDGTMISKGLGGWRGCPYRTEKPAKLIVLSSEGTC